MLKAVDGVWLKEDEEGIGIDFDRYIRLALDVCKDFTLLEITTAEPFFINTPLPE